MQNLKDIITAQIRQHGPMDIGTYMAMALGHPEHGYYMRRDPLGVAGDFTTAPEISQMFGELIGAWLGDYWQRGGAPKKFYLLECGPGRGTLMKDALRATKSIPGFHEAASLHMLETSPVLKMEQEKNLAAYQITWHDIAETLPIDAPLFVIANEFLDALSIRQLLFTKGIWHERVIGVNDQNELCFGLQDAPSPLIEYIPQDLRSGIEGALFEISPAREMVADNLCARIKKQGGIALFIDYGHAESSYGETFQAVKKHEYADPLQVPGMADLTAHVDFAVLGQIAQKQGLQVYGPVEQGLFLKRLGIDERAKALKIKAEEHQQAGIDNGLKRLTHPDEMGRLFKVIAFSSYGDIVPAGFQ